ncbi:hypothetical protein [Alkalibacterium sp. MB6]|uniref:hypothetical protein n=1 Tax=Alkalibacterium sp. MB6 TaxID=2081965 RepID=UPI00137B3A37|nr:hypothetical protein [Alkalibacterium sp. MB6]
MLINAKKMIKPVGWRERRIESFGEDPLECSECGNVMEFRGIAVLKKGHLTLQFANDVLAKKYINREIEIIESETYKCKIKEATRKAIKKYRFNWDQREKEINERYRVHLSNM